jgi:hypothetical protein
MFVLSAGMPKSGSTLLSLLQRDVLMSFIKDNAQEAFEASIIMGEFSGIGYFVDNIDTPEILLKLKQFGDKHGPFLVKSHCNLSGELEEMITQKIILASYIHRDPRDVILSAIDHGKRPVRNPMIGNFFSQFIDVPSSIPLVQSFCTVAIQWINQSDVLKYTYHELLNDPVTAIITFTKALEINPEANQLQRIISHQLSFKETGKRQFNTGKILRFREEMSSSDLHLCNKILINEIISLGYQVTPT